MTERWVLKLVTPIAVVWWVVEAWGSCEVMCGHVRSGDVRCGHVGSGQVRSCAVRWGQVWSCEVWWGHVQSDEVRWGQARSGEVRSREVRCVNTYQYVVKMKSKYSGWKIMQEVITVNKLLQKMMRLFIEPDTYFSIKCCSMKLNL